MRINEFSIHQYGPLEETGKIKPGNFALFFGRNEDGKTVTIEALIKMLLGDNTKDFQNINRVEEQPDGYILIEDDEGTSHKITRRKTFNTLTNLTGEECRNLFIIRNSDLEIKQGGEFYTHLTDRLTNLQTNRIKAITKQLLSIGKITKSGALSNKDDDQKLKDRHKSAEKLTTKINVLITETSDKGLDQLENQLSRKKLEERKLISHIKDLEDARLREKYKDGRLALSQFEVTSTEYEALSQYTQEEATEWVKNRELLDKTVKRKEDLQETLKKHDVDLKRSNQETHDINTELEKITMQKRHLEEITPDIRIFEREKLRETTINNKISIYKRLTFGTLLVVGILAIGQYLKPEISLESFVGIFTLVFFFSVYMYIKTTNDKENLYQLFNKIKLHFAKSNHLFNSIEEILSYMHDFDNKFASIITKEQEKSGNVRLIKSNIEELKNERIPRREEEIKKYMEKIEHIKKNSKVNSPEEYAKVLAKKSGFEKEKNNNFTILSELFKHLEEGSTKENRIDFWREELDSLQKYENKVIDLNFDEKEKHKSEKLLSDIQATVKELESDLSNHRSEMLDIGRETSYILNYGREEIICQTSVDLQAISKKLTEFINENIHRKDIVLELISIFEELELEERQKVSQLISESSISEIMSKITDHRYVQVGFDLDEGELLITQKDGLVLKSHQLSSSTYDQLYLSLRIALGEKLLKGKKAFFILDDPFVKSDPVRLKYQMDLLHSISREGWQIIYFSAKQEIYDILIDEIEKGIIKQFSVSSIPEGS